MRFQHRKDWLISVILALGILLFARIGWLEPLEDWLYETQMSWLATPPHPDILLVAIDDQSLQALSGWPLSYTHYARAVQWLNQQQPRLLGNTLFWHQLEYESIYPVIQTVLDFYEASELLNRAFDDDPQIISEINQLGIQLGQLKQVLNPEQILARAIQNNGKFIQAMPFWLDQQLTTETANPILQTQPLPTSIIAHRLQQVNQDFQLPEAPPRRAAMVIPPLSALQRAIAGVGGLAPGDFDPKSSPYLSPLVFQYQQHYYPSLSLALAAKALDAPISVALGQGVRIGTQRFMTDAQLQARPWLYRPFPVISLAQILQNQADPDRFRDKIVLLGLTASSLQLPQQALANASVAPLLQVANTLSSLLNQQLVSQPRWMLLVQAIAGLLTLLFCWFVLSPRNPAWLTLASFMGLLLLLMVQWVLLLWMSWWIPLSWAMLLLLSVWLVLILKYISFTLRHQVHLGNEAIEANRLLGLAWQGQGRLEAAFEKFLLCPVDKQMAGILYNLALDFERKAQTRQALAAYQYLIEKSPNYRDVEQRLLQLQTAQRARLPGKYASNRLSQWLEANSELRKPMLGRYQIEKKLGKGAMGVVYLGRDSKMDRMVAIKTLALAAEFEGEALQDAIARFFRGASAAGRLTHESIIAVYDAGEEGDLAYIAMEYFKGGSLAAYTRPNNILPLDNLFDIAIKTAEALFYAHERKVVHRDIKPDNILYNAANGQFKLTDFGIARITDSQKTRTGIILGTPSYMSPEQLAGKTVDGRSDLFSLGVSLYQLLTGALPFEADSMASLMFQIASEPHRDILSVRKDLPVCLQEVIDILLEKNYKNRYPDGASLAEALRQCRDQWILQAYVKNQPELKNGSDTSL